MTQAVPEQRPQLPGFSKWLAPQWEPSKRNCRFLVLELGLTQPQAPRRAATQRPPQPAAALRSLPARAPTAPHGARHTTHATQRAPSASRADRTATSRAVCSSHAHTHSHKRPDAPRRSGPPARRRLALASGSRVDRTAQRATRHARSTLRAFLTHTHTHTALAKRHNTALAERHNNHKRPDAPRHSGPPSPPSPRTRFRLARRPHRTVCSTPRTPHIARRPLRAPTAPQHYAPSAHHTRTHTATTPREPRCSGLPSPPPPRTRFRLARRPHRTVRSTPRTPHIVRRPIRAPTAPQHCAPSAQHTRTLPATTPCEPRCGGLPSPPPPRTRFRLARTAPHRAHTSHATLVRPLRTQHMRAIRSTHTHAHHDAPTRRDAAGPSARRRLALASGSRADRTARCAAHHARSTLRATLRTQKIARHPLNIHTYARPRTPRRAAKLRTLQPAAASTARSCTRIAHSTQRRTRPSVRRSSPTHKHRAALKQHSPRTRPAHTAPPPRRTRRRTYRPRRRSPPARQRPSPFHWARRPARACGPSNTNVQRTHRRLTPRHSRARPTPQRAPPPPRATPDT